MDVSNMLARDRMSYDGAADARRQSHQYPTRNALTSQVPQNIECGSSMCMGTPLRPYDGLYDPPRPLPRGKQQKQVSFELLLPVPQHRARLPMRVMISPHDTTESIITTVKNFYGLYDGPGVSFQDREGSILIAAYENFDHDMTVYVRVTPEESPVAPVQDRQGRSSMSPRKPKLGAPFEMRPPSHPSRPASRGANARSPSPQSVRSHHSASATAGKKSQSRPYKSQEPGSYNDINGDAFSDSDGGNASVTSSRRSKIDAHASAEISVDNIVEGGRRKRAKFESSELPLFVPPQVPMTASISSVSPQRRITGDSAASPLPFSNQRTFVYTQPMPSPQSYGRSDNMQMSNGHMGGVWAQPLPYSNGPQLRGRGPTSYGAPRQSTGGILPTPEPTVGSVISDEDVALQLMRLGDVSNFSHGRTSTSTLDDALSGKAEAASSDEVSGNEDEAELPNSYRQPSKDHPAGPRKKKQRMLKEDMHSDSVQSSEEEYNDGPFKGDSDGHVLDQQNNNQMLGKLPKSKSTGSLTARGSMSSHPESRKSGKARIPGAVHSKSKTPGAGKVPLSPASLPSQSRKASLASTINFQNPLGPDEDDLSSKPRCQRCRKSKKGCDRQRPCGRCKDAGIGVDGCVSEDEGNGRRGRYGRHMGVSIKKDGSENADDDGSPPPAIPNVQFLAPALPSDKSKKRKR